MGAMRAVCFLSDYGYADDFAGTCRGVITRLAPNVHVIDISHGTARHDVLGGAFVLRNTLPYMPDGAVHLAVVDPMVGWQRRALALRSASDRMFVGPDNGLLTLAASADGGVVGARELTNQELWLKPLSETFHGRDVFAPVAARLAAGLPFEEAGREIEPASLVTLELPPPRRTRHGLRAQAVLIDRFGNIALNLDQEELQRAKLGERIEVVCAGERYLAQVARTFASVRPSDIVLLIDSYGQAALAVNTGSAREVLSLSPGDMVELRRLGEPEGSS
jgi:S-adenosyl-L-methionine hydrolase (adenosine-forming)